MPSVEQSYYPGRLYEGIQLYLDFDIPRRAEGRDFLSELGVPPKQIAEAFRGTNGLYLRPMNDALSALVADAWAGKDDPEIGALRYLAVRLLHELMSLPAESEPGTYFTRSQIAIVKAAGYENQGKFAKVFAEVYGVSPPKSRRLSKGGGTVAP